MIIQLTILASATGALSMWLYKICSPQERLVEIVGELKQTQRQLMSFDGEFAEAQPLIWQSLSLSLQRLGMVLFPSLMAAAPILVILTWGLTAYRDANIYPALQFNWIDSSELLFLLIATIAAIVVKVVFRIKC